MRRGSLLAKPGLGCGWHEPEFRAFGIPFSNVVSRFEEAMSIIHPLLREGPADFQGQYYSALDCELVPPDDHPGGIPILIASKQPRMMELTARFADQWNTAWHGHVAYTAAGTLDTGAAVDSSALSRLDAEWPQTRWFDPVPLHSTHLSSRC